MTKQSTTCLFCHNNVITFQYQLERIESIKVGHNYHKANYTTMKRKLTGIDWKELFPGKDINLSWITFLKLLNNIILKLRLDLLSTKNVKNLSG